MKPFFFLIAGLVAGICLSPRSGAAAVDLPQQLQVGRSCVSESLKSFQKARFGEEKEDMDAEVIDVLCTGNDDPKIAIACVNEVYKVHPLMRPMGLAQVCSQGVSGDYAKACLAKISKYFNWQRTVRSCTGTTYVVGSCLLPPNRQLSCPKSSVTPPATKARP